MVYATDMKQSGPAKRPALYCQLPPPLYLALKTHCVRNGLKIKTYVRELIEHDLRNGGKRGAR